jgi:hypothetical protein
MVITKEKSVIDEIEIRRNESKHTTNTCHFKVWQNSTVKRSDPGLFFFERVFIAASVSLHVIGLFK